MMLIRDGLPSLLIPARTVLKVSVPVRLRLTRFGSSRSSNMNSRNSSWVIWKTNSSMPSPELPALPARRRHRRWAGDVFAGSEFLVAGVHDGLFAAATVVKHRFVDVAPGC
jgi:hypothetical protein